MQLSDVINVGLGLAFTFFFLSLIASGIQEFIAVIFNWREKYRAKALDVLLSNDPNATFRWYGAADWLRAHFTTLPGMTALQHSKLKPLPNDFSSFVREDLLSRLALRVKNHPLIRNISADLPSSASGKAFTRAFLSALSDGSQNSQFEQIRNTIYTLPAGDLQTTLQTCLADATNIDQFRTNIEAWYNSGMDRLARIYKRQSQQTTLIIGFILAVALNVNTLHLAYVIWINSSSSLADLSTLASQAKSAGATQTFEAAEINMVQMQMLGPPIGWSYMPNWRALLTAGYWPPHLAHFVAHHLAGWAITAAAVSFGAPYWFELFQKFSNMRGAVKSDGADPASAKP